MKKQEIILNLIQQDLKHNQLLSGLNKIGLEGSDLHNLGILKLVSKLMKVPVNLENDWDCVYLNCMEEAINHKITCRGETLEPLAEVCYLKLKKILDNPNE